MNQKIQASEWLLVASFITILSSLALIAKISSHRASHEIEVEESPLKKRISVTIDGAVAKPGSYAILPGAPLKSVLSKSKPKPNADLLSLDLDLPIEYPQSISVKELSEITVKIQGAVKKSLELTVPVGTRICDLKSKIDVLPEADPAFFRKRRKLKNGEILVVAKKSIE